MNPSLATRLALVSTLSAAAGCGAPPLDGTFNGAGETPLPALIAMPPDNMLQIEAVFDLDEATGHFTLAMDLEFMGLMDDVTVDGDYVAENGELTLEPTALTGSTGMTSVVEGVQCITLERFAGTPVCFPPSSHPFTDTDGALAFTFDHLIAGEAGTTTLTLTEAP